MSLPKLPGKHKLFWLHSSAFALESNSLKMLISGVFLPVREPLVATFSETRAATSQKDMVEQSINISKVICLFNNAFIMLMNSASKFFRRNLLDSTCHKFSEKT